MTKVSKEIDPNIIIAKPDKKTVLLCFNGFQNRDMHDLQPLFDYFSLKNDNDLLKIVPVSLYSPSQVKTHHHKLYLKNAEKAIKQYIDEGYQIYLLGYSFSAALACRMEYKYRRYVKKLILVAPIYDTIINGMVQGYINYVLKFKKLTKKYGEKVAKTLGRSTTKGMIGLLLSILFDVLVNRKYYKKVSCDTLIIRGTLDELSTLHSLKKIRKRIKANNILYTYDTMSHAILRSEKENGVVYDDILHFAFNITPQYDSEASFIMKKQEKSKNKVLYDEFGNPLPSFLDIFDELNPDSTSDELEDQILIP